MEKYFLHRIQKENGVITKGIEVHDTKDSAILAFVGRMKTAFNNPQYPGMTFVQCMITDVNGAILGAYNACWKKDGETALYYFMHHIKLDGETFSKDIDVCDMFDTARYTYEAAMEYGYNNPKFPNVSLVSCVITDMGGAVMQPYNETWRIPDPEPEHPTPDPEQQQ